MLLLADYWVGKADSPDEILSSSEEIEAINRDAFASDPNMVELADYPTELAGGEVANIIQSISRPYEQDLFYRDGGKVGDADYRRYTDSLNLSALPDRVPIRFGMILQRADMRTWPTEDVVFESKETFDLDRFQENGLFPADVVAILHESDNGMWVFVQSYNYAAWVRKSKTVVGERTEILAYRDARDFLVVIGSKVATNFNPHSPYISELQLDMGIRLPLANPDEIAHDVDGQNPAASFAVRLPANDGNGALTFRTALIARSQDVRSGYLPYTRKNIIEQAFKFLGERYGWGHSYNARDCTGLVSEVYKTVGIVLPRNSEQQGHSSIGENVRLSPEATAEEKSAAIASADVGDLLYSTGHVMMYLGTVDGQPYVIHDLSGSGRVGAPNGVSVTPLTPVEQLYAIKKIR